LKPIIALPSNVDYVTAAECSLAARLGLWLIRAYKIFVSPYFAGSCRFLPSCADYASEAIARHGLIEGGWLATARLVRCHPLCAAGHDPVPSKFSGR